MVGLGFGGHHYFSYNHLFALLLLGSNTGNDNSAECRLTTGSAVFPADYMVHCGPYIPTIRDNYYQKQNKRKRCNVDKIGYINIHTNTVITKPLNGLLK
jgi:hypothetical protein